MGKIHMNVGALPMPLAWHMLELQYFSVGFCGQETKSKGGVHRFLLFGVARSVYSKLSRRCQYYHQSQIGVCFSIKGWPHITV
jgi:hypothetical protein